MTKILLAFDGAYFSDNAIQFARKLTETSSNSSYRLRATAEKKPQVAAQTMDGKKVREAVERFKVYCSENGIEQSHGKNYPGIAPAQLHWEARFADLLIINSEVFYEQFSAQWTGDCLLQTIHHIECPVIVTPDKFQLPESTILCYDGSASSIYAIKQFAYLFPEMLDRPVILVYIKETDEDTLPGESNTEELAARYFSRLALFDPATNSEKFFLKWLNEQKGSIVVSGSFGRPEIFRSFQRSFIANIINELRLPVFMTHR